MVPAGCKAVEARVSVSLALAPRQEVLEVDERSQMVVGGEGMVGVVKEQELCGRQYKCSMRISAFGISQPIGAS